PWRGGRCAAGGWRRRRRSSRAGRNWRPAPRSQSKDRRRPCGGCTPRSPGEGPMRVHDDWLLTPERAALHLPTGTAVVADLHLGYDQVRRRGGEAVPAVGLEEALAALGAVVFRHDVRRLVIAGDLFEDGRCAGQAAELLNWLAAAGVELVGLVPGNHDRGLSQSGT